MDYYERKPEDMKPLKFKVGDKVMGYAQRLGIGMLVGGEIVDCRQSKSHLNDNDYLVKFEPEISPHEIYEGARDTGDWWIDENDCVPFDQTRWLEAVKHYKNEHRLRADAWNEHLKMLTSLAEEGG